MDMVDRTPTPKFEVQETTFLSCQRGDERGIPPSGLQQLFQDVVRLEWGGLQPFTNRALHHSTLDDESNSMLLAICIYIFWVIIQNHFESISKLLLLGSRRWYYYVSKFGFPGVLFQHGFCDIWSEIAMIACNCHSIVMCKYFFYSPHTY